MSVNAQLATIHARLEQGDKRMNEQREILESQNATLAEMNARLVSIGTHGAERDAMQRANGEKLDSILIQTQKTNGRVNGLEARELIRRRTVARLTLSAKKADAIVEFFTDAKRSVKRYWAAALFLAGILAFFVSPFLSAMASRWVDTHLGAKTEHHLTP